MKKNVATALSLLLCVTLCVTLSLPLSATAHDGLCGCGREFATADSDRYMIHDCLGCGRNFTSCTCRTCWCGGDLTKTETESGMTVYTCDDCGLPCEECVCRDRSYYDALRDVKQGLTGQEIPNPQNGLWVALAALLPFGLFLGAYFTVYRRQSSTRARKNRSSALERILDEIDREGDNGKRYAKAKEWEEKKRGEDPSVFHGDGMLLCLRKNELLGQAVEEDHVRTAAEENLRTCRKRNDFGFAGSVEQIDRLWDFKKKRFFADRNEVGRKTPAENLVKWDTADPRIALFETVTPLNGRENNLLSPASNVTRFTARIFEKEPLMNRKTDPSTEEQRRQTLRSLVPEGDVEALMALPKQMGATQAPPAGLPDEVSAKRMGEKTRFHGGLTK